MKYCFTLILLFAGLLSMAQQIVWEHTWGDSTTSMGRGILVTKDHTILVNALGDDGQPTSGKFPVTYVEYDMAGNLLNEKEGSKLAYGEEDLIQLSDSSYLFVGCQIEQGTPFPVDAEVFLQKLTKHRDSVWTVRYPGIGMNDFATQLLPLDSGQALIIGMTRRLSAPNLAVSYYTLRKVDSLGNLIWYREFAPNYGYGTNAVRNRNGNYILVAHSNRPDPPGYWHPYFLEVNPQGDSLQSKTVVVRDVYQNEVVERGLNNILQTFDGNYVVSGYLDSANQYSGFVMKIDTAFNMLWKYIYRSPFMFQKGFKIHENPDSTLLFLTNGTTGNQFNVIKLNAEGLYMGKRVFTSSLCNRIFPYDWEVLNDTSFVMTASCNHVSELAYVVKAEFSQILSTTQEELAANISFLGLAYPNPASGSVTIPYALPAGAQSATLTLYDGVKGAVVREYVLSAAATAQEIDLSGLSSGLYACSLSVEGKVVGRQKLAVLR